MNNEFLPPPPGPPSFASMLENFITIMGGSADARQGARDAILELERHSEAIARLELAGRQHELRVQADREQLAREREAFEALMTEREAAVKAEDDKVEAKRQRLREIGQELRRLRLEIEAINAEEAALVSAEGVKAALRRTAASIA